MLRDKRQLGLGALHIALARNPAGADGDHGLDDIVARSQGVRLRASGRPPAFPSDNPLKMPDQRTGRSTHKKYPKKPFVLNSAHVHQDKGNWTQRQGGAQIRLFEDKIEGSSQHPKNKKESS